MTKTPENKGKVRNTSARKAYYQHQFYVTEANKQRRADRRELLAIKRANKKAAKAITKDPMAS